MTSSHSVVMPVVGRFHMSVLSVADTLSQVGTNMMFKTKVLGTETGY